MKVKEGGEMNVYRIIEPGLHAQIHCVVAESYAKAEEIWLEKYGSNPDSIELYSKYVLVQL